MKKQITCKCGYSWEYEGKMKYYTTCPDCRNAVKLREAVES